MRYALPFGDSLEIEPPSRNSAEAVVMGLAEQGGFVYLCLLAVRPKVLT
jgi:hypothetical protein